MQQTRFRIKDIWKKFHEYHFPGDPGGYDRGIAPETRNDGLEGRDPEKYVFCETVPLLLISSYSACGPPFSLDRNPAWHLFTYLTCW